MWHVNVSGVICVQYMVNLDGFIMIIDNLYGLWIVHITYEIENEILGFS